MPWRAACQGRACIGAWLPLLAGIRTCSGDVPMVPAPRDSTVEACEHRDPLDSSRCYEPVCPEGYFRCCATCQVAECYGTAAMNLSWRGIEECILCNPGDYCVGDDKFETCELSDTPGREGLRISRAGSTERSACEACTIGQEAGLIPNSCWDRYSDECDKDKLLRCMRFCEAPDPWRRKDLTQCEMMKCQMYCAKIQSDECAARIGLRCEYLTEIGPNSQYQDDADQYLVGCDVDCSTAWRRAVPSFVVASAMAAISLLRYA
mmetsp:Transcript_22115/g.40652  ORF Transcript_22115/g.40652 Transcript_22115/m.40652 type:complete len:263 (-) Transcript_22115:112-900(-)